MWSNDTLTWEKVDAKIAEVFDNLYGLAWSGKQAVAVGSGGAMPDGRLVAVGFVRVPLQIKIPPSKAMNVILASAGSGTTWQNVEITATVRQGKILMPVAKPPQPLPHDSNTLEARSTANAHNETNVVGTEINSSTVRLDDDETGNAKCPEAEEPQASTSSGIRGYACRRPDLPLIEAAGRSDDE